VQICFFHLLSHLDSISSTVREVEDVGLKASIDETMGCDSYRKAPVVRLKEHDLN
jgi:hypothetical protein